jgi:hypothetical protein
MNTLVLDAEPLAVNVETTQEYLQVMLTDGRVLLIPLDWYPRLQHAAPTERTNWHLLGDGYAIEWPDLDEQIGVEGLIAGRRSGESEASFQSWLNKRLLENDPLLQLAGIIDDIDIPDLATEHDKYIGASLLHNGE